MNQSLLSPFHQGEQKIQKQLGVRERMERFGQKVIRDYMPDQHRDFFQHLQYLLVGHVDKYGWPWTSILFGEEGFIHSPNERQLVINTQPVPGDPLAQSLYEDSKVGLLGIELSNRRRNRIAGNINHSNKENIEINVEQAFGNCPKYIQRRELINEPSAPNSLTPTHLALENLDSEALALITNADTFFVSSFIDNINSNSCDAASEGVDVSHRGGMPGFIHIDEESKLTIPDYSGNFHFNTLGNFIENPKAGLLFIDFEKGHLLMLTGKVEVLFNSPEIVNFEGTERLWTFELDHGLRLKNVLPSKWALHDYSPFLPG
jgi:predicted pyridoxine 5'-phosphate oxidase superfamily flavin-nucleotide-binding protein